MQRILRRCACCIALAGVLLAGSNAGASGEPPLRLTGQIIDHASVLDPAQSAQVTSAIQRLHADTGSNLYVVYVRSFDDSSPSGWATRTASLSQLGHGDVLLAVAVNDRAYDIYYDYASTIDPQKADSIATQDVGPRLAGNDWSGAAIELADELGTTNDLPIGWIVGAVVLGVAVLGGAAFLLVRRRRVSAVTATPARAADPPVSTSPVDVPRAHATVVDGPHDDADGEPSAPGDELRAAPTDDDDDEALRTPTQPAPTIPTVGRPSDNDP